MPYEAAVQGWHDFYIVAGSAAATLMGLLFVGLSLHLRAVLSRPDMRTLARATFTNFTVVLLLALFILIPQSAGGLSQELVFSGIVSVAILTPSLLRATRSPTLTLRVAQLAIRFGVSILGYAAVVAAGALFSAGAYETGLTMLVVVAVVLLVMSLRNSWDLLISVGDATLGVSKPVGERQTRKQPGLRPGELGHPARRGCKPAGKPGSVTATESSRHMPRFPMTADGHPSGTPVARRLVRPDPGL